MGRGEGGIEMKGNRRKLQNTRGKMVYHKALLSDHLRYLMRVMSNILCHLSSIFSTPSVSPPYFLPLPHLHHPVVQWFIILLNERREC